MTEEKLPLDDIGDLAEQAISDKRAEMGSEEQARELYDVPTESARELEEQQREG